MTLPLSPPISLSAICAEFGAPSNTPLASFLRGGAFVPNTPGNSGVPTSLPISMSNLLGASGSGGGAVNLADHSLSSSRGVGIASVTYQFKASGTIQWSEAPSNSGTYGGEWLLSGSAAAYDVRVTGVVNAVLTGIANGVWQNAAADWTAALSASVPATDFNDVLAVELRPTGGGATLATAAIGMYAERF